MAGAVETLAIAYYFTGEERYAERAALLIRVWFLDPATKMNPHFRYAQAIPGHNDGRGAGLIESRHFIKVVDAAGLLGGSRAWTDKDAAGVESAGSASSSTGCKPARTAKMKRGPRTITAVGTPRN